MGPGQRVCACVCACVWVCVCMHMCACACMQCMCMGVHVYVSMCVHVHGCGCACACVRVYGCACACVWVFMCICACAYVCTHIQTIWSPPCFPPSHHSLQWPPQTTVKPPAPPLPPSPSLLLANSLTSYSPHPHSHGRSLSPLFQICRHPRPPGRLFSFLPTALFLFQVIPSSCALDSIPRASQEPSRIGYSSSSLFPSHWKYFHLLPPFLSSE